MPTDLNEDQIRDAVRERYAALAKRVPVEQQGGCCSSAEPCCGGDSISGNLYAPADLRDIPQGAVAASLGCGNPTLLAELRPGQVVLDLGSGGGIDVLLSARRVGPGGKAYGLDMTDEMLALARDNARKAGARNVEFLKGHIESIPLPDASVDVIISNCVINLSANKDAVLAEAYRVLRPGGTFAVADIVVQGGPLPESMRHLMALWAGCVSGALGEDEYKTKLAAAGFSRVDVRTLKSFDRSDVPAELLELAPKGLDLDPGTRIISAFIKAEKPT